MACFDGFYVKISSAEDVELEALLADKTAELDLAADGMYPIRTNGGICVSSIMAKINGQ